MSRDLHLYSLSLMIVVLLWFAPARADQYYGTCPRLEVPVQLSGNDVWASYDDPDNSSEDYRGLYPAAGIPVNVSGDGGVDVYGCEIEIGEGRYYDGANHMWVLDGSLTCAFGGQDTGEFRAGDVDY